MPRPSQNMGMVGGNTAGRMPMMMGHFQSPMQQMGSFQKPQFTPQMQSILQARGMPTQPPMRQQNPMMMAGGSMNPQMPKMGQSGTMQQLGQMGGMAGGNMGLMPAAPQMGGARGNMMQSPQSPGVWQPGMALR